MKSKVQRTVTLHQGPLFEKCKRDAQKYLNDLIRKKLDEDGINKILRSKEVI